MNNNEEKIDWIFYPYLAKKHLTALTSQTGEGKSYLASWWAMKLSNAGKKVLYVDTYADRLTEERLNIFQTTGKNNPDYVKFSQDENKIENLLAIIKDKNYDLVIIDAFVFAVGFEGYHEDYIRLFKEYAVKSNTSYLLLFNAFGDKQIPVANNREEPVELVTDLFSTTLLLVAYNKYKHRNLFCTKAIINEKNNYNISLVISDRQIKFSFLKPFQNLKAKVFPYWKFVLDV